MERSNSPRPRFDYAASLLARSAPLLSSNEILSCVYSNNRYYGTTAFKSRCSTDVRRIFIFNSHLATAVPRAHTASRTGNPQPWRVVDVSVASLCICQLMWRVPRSRGSRGHGQLFHRIRLDSTRLGMNEGLDTCCDGADVVVSAVVVCYKVGAEDVVGTGDRRVAVSPCRDCGRSWSARASGACSARRYPSWCSSPPSRRIGAGQASPFFSTQQPSMSSSTVH